MKKMKRIVIPVLLLASGITLASCGSSASAHSKSFNAGVAWVRNGFPGHNDISCDFSVFYTGFNCAQSNGPCDSSAAILAESSGNYNMQQWIDGCASVPFKHYPTWYKNDVNNLNG